MAKKGPSKHSRAARRATSPGIDLDKSLKAVKAPEKSANERPSILGIHQSAGVSKKQKQGRVLSSRARKRQEKGLDRAAAVIERTAKKVERSKSQAGVIQSRSKEWSEINSRISKETEAQASKKLGMFGALAGGGGDADDDDTNDEDASDADSGDEAVRKFYDDGLDEKMGEAAPIAAAIPLAALANEDEDIM